MPIEAGGTISTEAALLPRAGGGSALLPKGTKMNQAVSGILVSVLSLGLGAGASAVPPDGVDFNGLTAYAVVEDGEPFDLDAFTLAAWVKLRDRSGSQVFLGRGGAGELFTLYLLRGRVRMLVEHAEGRYTHAHVEAPPVDRWTHFAGTYDGREIKIYVNGAPAQTTPAPGRIPPSAAPLYLGALGPGERALDGWLEDAAVWGRVLSDAEIGQLARQADEPGLTTGLVARWTARSLDGDRWPGTGAAGSVAEYHAQTKIVCPHDDGYRGIWYSNQKQDDEYVYKYSGGLGTYCAKHRPFAVYAPEVNKTFFCYGGAPKGKNTLVHMVSYYDHETGTVPRPRRLLDKRTSDAHDNPVISLDDRGHVWIFSSSHGTARPSYISVSTRPYDIESFERVVTTNFSYTQPHYVPGKGFLFLHTRYGGGRRLFQMTSADGRTWTEPEMLAHVEKGHYQVSGHHGAKVATAFNFHPTPRGLNWRTNLYYVETDDFGRTWKNVRGEAVELPLTKPDNPALAHDYQTEKRNVYLKDLVFDAEGRPVILHLTSGGWQSGPGNDPRIWQTARWTGEKWEIRGSIRSDNNYDMGSLYVEKGGLWRLIAPTEPGPQPYNIGGEIAMWTSRDQGATWTKLKQLTRQSELNHTYVRRPVDAHPDFYALWADGHGRKPSESRLYFTNRDGDHVWRLPVEMSQPTAKPEAVW